MTECRPLTQQQRQLVEENIRLVGFTIKKYFSGVDNEELYSLGCQGLIRAAQRYRADSGYKFSSFGVPAIRNAIYADYVKRRRREERLHIMSYNEKYNDIEWLESIPSPYCLEDEVIERLTNQEISCDPLGKLISKRQLKKLSPRRQQILMLCLQDKLPAKQETLAKMFDVAQPTISRDLKFIRKVLGRK